MGRRVLGCLLCCGEVAQQIRRCPQSALQIQPSASRGFDPAASLVTCSGSGSAKVIMWDTPVTTRDTM